MKKYGSYCSRRRLILENRNSAQDLGRVFIPCGLRKDLSFDFEMIWKHLYQQPKWSSQGKESFTGKHSAVSTLGSLMTCWMMSEAWTLWMAATGIMEGGEKAAAVRGHTNTLQLWLGKLAKKSPWRSNEELGALLNGTYIRNLIYIPCIKMEESLHCLQWLFKETNWLNCLSKFSILFTSTSSFWGRNSSTFFPTVQIRCRSQVGVQIANMILSLARLCPTMNTGRDLLLLSS